MTDKKIGKLVELFLNNGEDGPSEAEMDALEFGSSVQPARDSFKRPPVDMDYTLAIYKQEFEELSYKLIIERLIEMGYPAAIFLNMHYDPKFSIRGLFVDKELGNFLKIDNFGNILLAVHGRKVLSKVLVAKLYPSLRIHNEDIGRRFYLLNTMFNIPEACVFADLVEYFESAKVSPKAEAHTTSHSDEIGGSSFDLAGLSSANIPTTSEQSTVIRVENMDIYWKNLFTDVHDAMDWTHTVGTNKPEVLKDIGKYILKTPKLPEFLHNLRKNNKKTFLLTNSPWYYTQAVMSFLLNDQMPDTYKDWLHYFDYVIVSAEKPNFFANGNTLREVDIATGRLKIGRVEGDLKRGLVYYGGSLEKFEKMAGIKDGTRVMYVGDHIFADVRVSKKKHGWRTLLVIPELERELTIWSDPITQKVYNRLVALQHAKAAIFRNLDSDAKNPPDIRGLQKAIRRANQEKDERYNEHFGSLFTSGLKASFFGMQVQRYADLYTAHYWNLLKYPMFYTFYPEAALLPHETYV